MPERREKISQAYQDVIRKMREQEEENGVPNGLQAFQEEIVSLRNRILLDICDDDSVICLFAMIDIVSALAHEFGLPREWIQTMFEMNFEKDDDKNGKILRFADLTEGEWGL